MIPAISAIILAAGYGRRIGKPKLMLECGGKNFLSIILTNLLKTSVQNISCIVNKDNLHWVKEKIPALNTIINPVPENGMMSSVYYGLNDDAYNSDGYLIIPVDHPFVSKATFDILIHTFEKNPDVIIKPSYKNKTGHPIIIPFSLKKYITESDIPGGLNKIIQDSGIKQIVVETNDAGILKNINYKEDL